jgi:hypothetical protein
MAMLLGCLNHAGFVIPLSRHFLGRLQQAQYAAEKRCTGVKLTTPQCDDLILWKTLLRQAHDGISLNQLTYQKRTHIT